MTISNPPGVTTVRAFVPAWSGWNETDSLVIDKTESNAANEAVGVSFPDSKECIASVAWRVPDKYEGNLKARAVVYSSGGDVYIYTVVYVGSSTGTYNSYSDSDTFAAVTLSSATDEVREYDLSSEVSVGDYVRYTINRRAGNAADTLNDVMVFMGVIFEYDEAC